MKNGRYKTGRRPDFTLSAINKANEHKGKIGAAWKNEDGTINIVLNPFVVLSSVQDLIITLFPADEPKSKKNAGKTELDTEQ